MEPTKGNGKSTIVWVVVGVVVAAVVIYLAVSGTFGNLGGGANKAPAVTGSATTTAQGVVQAPGSSAIASSGIVVTPEGTPVDNAAQPGTPTAPKESNPLTSVSDVPTSAVKITMAATGITPSTFTVKAGEAVTLSVADGDTQSHIFKFEDPSLAAVAVGIGPGDPIRVLSFNAPTKPGSYVYYCDVPGHRARGEQGTMVVQ